MKTKTMKTMTAKEASNFMRTFLKKEEAGDFADDPYDAALTLFDYVAVQTKMRGRQWAFFVTVLRLFAGCLAEVSRHSAARSESRRSRRSPGVARTAVV